ncbi:MAG: hypothetical protein ACKOKE_07220 [Actinomycetota bacterium]
MKKFLLSIAATVLGLVGVMNVAVAEVPDRVTVCVVSNGQGDPGHEIEIPAQAADNAPFDRSCGEGSGYGGRISAADTAEELAETR